MCRTARLLAVVLRAHACVCGFVGDIDGSCREVLVSGLGLIESSKEVAVCLSFTDRNQFH